MWIALAGRLLVATSTPNRADAVIVLSGGDPLGPRVQTGAEVATRLEASRLVVFLEPSEPQFDPREAITAFLLARGASPDAIRFGGPVGSTAEEAGWIGDLAERCGWEDVVVITSPWHTRRAGWLIGGASPDTTAVHMVAADEPFPDWLWWTGLDHVRTVASEWLRIVGDLPDVIGGPADVSTVLEC